MRIKILDFNYGLLESIRMINQIDKPVLVLITGGSCSGKTFLADQLKDKLGQQGVSVMPLDSFFRDLDDPDLPLNKSGQSLFDVPDSYHQQEFISAVRALLSGKDSQIPYYDRGLNRRMPEKFQVVESRPIVIVEGLFVMTMLDEFWLKTIKIYVDTDVDICLQRRIERDTVLFGVSVERVEQTFRQKVLPNQKAFILPQRQRADIIIKT